MSKFILIGRNPVAIPDDQLIAWADWMGTTSRLLLRTEKKPRKKLARKGHLGTVRKLNRLRAQHVVISTIFLGLDHNWFGGNPVLFEPMICGGEGDGEMWRYETIEQALANHRCLEKTCIK